MFSLSKLTFLTKNTTQWLKWTSWIKITGPKSKVIWGKHPIWFWNDKSKSNRFIKFNILWTILTVCKRSCGKVMFSQACAKNSAHGRGTIVQAQGQGVSARGCPGPDPGGCLRRGWGYPGPGLGVSAWGRMYPSMHWGRTPPLPHSKTATAMDSTHPTGMHSCFCWKMGLIWNGVFKIII